MNLMLRAFGTSEKLTLKQRANRIIDLHRKFSAIVNQYKWNVIIRKKNKVLELDLNDIDGCYPYILQQVRYGLNAKVSQPINYQEHDIATISSGVHFFNSSFNQYDIQYYIGYPTRQELWGLNFGVDKINDETLFTREILRSIAILFITEGQPDMLCVTDRDYFHNISKPFHDKVAWTGWFTFLSWPLIVKRRKSLILNLFSQDFEKDISKINGIEVEEVKNGIIIWTTAETFSAKNSDHVNKALTIQKIFKKYKIPSLIEIKV